VTAALARETYKKECKRKEKMETLFWLIWRCRWVQRLGTFRWF
jgi:hypothetical protein